MPDGKNIKILLKDHVPYNKHRFDVTDSFCEVEVKDYDGSMSNPEAWTEIMLSETYIPKGGQRTVSRTIMVTLDPDQRSNLLKMLLGG